MKTLVYLSIFLFCIITQSITAQVCYSPTLNKIFVGPENVTNLSDTLINKQLHFIESHINKLERTRRDVTLNKGEDKVEGDMLLVEIDNLNLLLTNWQSLQKKENKNLILNLPKVTKGVSIERIPLQRKKEYRTTVVDGKSVTVEVDPNTIRRTNCGNYNCLSADPKDCIQWNLARSNYKFFKDSSGVDIPFNTIQKTYSHIQILDNPAVLECRREL